VKVVLMGIVWLGLLAFFFCCENRFFANVYFRLFVSICSVFLFVRL